MTSRCTHSRWVHSFTWFAAPIYYILHILYITVYHFIVSSNYYQLSKRCVQSGHQVPSAATGFSTSQFSFEIPNQALLDFNKPKCPRAPWHQWLSFPDKIAITTGEVTLLSKLPQFSGFFLEPTPGKINIKPENTPLEKEKHLPNHHFQVRIR